MNRRNLSPPPAALPRRRIRSGLPWGKMFLLGLIALLALAWFAPTLVVKSGFRDQLLNSALKDFPGKVVIGSASAGWLSPVEITKVSATNAQGEEVATVAAVRTEKNLFSLLLDRQQIGKITLEQPKLILQLRSDGSNVEDLLTPLMKSLESRESSGSTGYAIEIVDGSLVATYVGSEGKWQFEKLNASIAVPRDKAAPLTARMKADVIAAGAAPGGLQADVQWQPAAPPADPSIAPGLGQGTVTIQSKEMPLDIVTLAARRAGMDVQMAGSLTTDASLTITDKTQTVKIQQLAAQNLFVASPTLLGADQLQLASVSGSGEISRGINDWQFRAVNLQSEVATLTATGSGPSTGASSLGAGLAQAFRAGNWEIRGNLDVAKLAATLPNTLHLRSGTHVSSGQVALGLVSQSNADGNVWNAEVQANQLAAIHAGTAFEWKKPIVVKAAVRESAAGVIVDQLTCDSSFLQLSGAGTLEQGKFVLDGDLSQFVNEVGRFVDLGAIRAAGKFHSQVDWKNTAGNVLALSGNGSATNFELTYVAEQPWQEQQLDIEFTSDATIAAGRVAQVDRGDLRITAAGDNLEAQLLEPVRDINASTIWPCHVRVRGDLGRWLARLQMFVHLDGWQIDGEDMQLEGALRASQSRIELAATKGTVKNFLFNGSGLTIYEPTVELSTSAATYDMATGELVSPDTTIASSTIALRAQEVRLQYAQDKMALAGDVKYRTNLDRLSAWFRDPRQPATYRLQGEAAGGVRLTYANGATKADATASVDNFAYSTPAARAGLAITPVNQPPGWQDLWKEPRLELAVIGTLDAGGQQAVLEKLEIAGDSLSVGAAGSVREPFGRCELDLSGQYAYDLERLAQRFRGALGPQVQMQGTGQRPFSFRGPLLAASPSQPAVRTASNTAGAAESALSLQEMLGEISIGWQNLSVQGFEIGAGEVATKLERGFLTFSPIDLPVSEGKVAIVPTVDVNRSPYIATLQPGTVVDRVRISPQMCRSWLKYLAPLAADATAAEGHFSVTIDEAKFPVSDPTGGNIQAKLVIHSAQIGPGPLSQEILNVVQLIQSVINRQPPLLGQQSTISRWLDMPEQQLVLQLTDHKVHHRDMQFTVDGVEVRTSGWVGLDQQIALVAIVPVRDEWVSKDRYLASLKGQTIRLPINGTLSRPQLDRTALRQLTSQAVIGAGTNLLQEELGRGLNKIFQPRGAPAPAPQQPPR